MRWLSRIRTVFALVGHFVARDKAFFLPLLFVLMLAGVLLVLTSGLAHVAPFVYTLF